MALFQLSVGNVLLMKKNSSDKKQLEKTMYLRQFDEHVLKVTLLKSNLLLIKSEQIKLLLKDFTAFYYN